MEKKIKILHTCELPLERREVGEDYAFDRADIVRADGSSRCGVRIYSIPPGKANYPYHWHETHEEVFYVISGRGVVLTPEGESSLASGDALVCPPCAEGAHKITNTGVEPLVYLEFDTVSFPEVAHYPQSDGIGVLFANRQKNHFFIGGESVSYEELSERG